MTITPQHVACTYRFIQPACPQTPMETVPSSLRHCVVFVIAQFRANHISQFDVRQNFCLCIYLWFSAYISGSPPLKVYFCHAMMLYCCRGDRIGIEVAFCSCDNVIRNVLYVVLYSNKSYHNFTSYFDALMTSCR